MCIIPAREESKRFPRKVLFEISGKPIIGYVIDGCINSDAKRVIVATDSEEIAQVSKKFGAEAVITGDANSGSDRVAKVVKTLNLKEEFVINVQGDEPLVEGELINRVARELQNKDVEISTPVYEISNSEEAKNYNRVKVITDNKWNALYFSRYPIPFGSSKFFIHIGIYGFRRDALFKYTSLKPSKLELVEKLEQLRALENGMKIKIVKWDKVMISVDTPEDIDEVKRFLKL